MKRILMLMAGILIAGFSSAQAACPDASSFDAVLKANVDKDGFVDYEEIRAKKGGDLITFTNSIQTADLSTCDDMGKLAFWINAYNANMIRLVLARPTLKQVSEDFKIFAEKFKVAGQMMTLNDIENRVIRADPKKGGPIKGVSLTPLNPRVHFALNCGAIDCPKLLNTAYSGATIESVLQSNAAAFANGRKHIHVENGKLVISTLMKWYEEDFAKLGGVPAFLIPLTDKSLRPDADEIDAKLKTDFPKKVEFKYDWTLNSVKNKR